MCRVILSPTDLFQIDSKDCLHLVLVRCQLIILFRVQKIIKCYLQQLPDCTIVIRCYQKFEIIETFMYAVVQSLIDLRQIQGLFNEGTVDILYEFKDNWTSILHPRQWRFQREMRPARNCTFRLQSTKWQFRPSTPYRKKYPWDNWRVWSD